MAYSSDQFGATSGAKKASGTGHQVSTSFAISFTFSELEMFRCISRSESSQSVFSVVLQKFLFFFFLSFFLSFFLLFFFCV